MADIIILLLVLGYCAFIPCPETSESEKRRPGRRLRLLRELCRLQRLRRHCRAEAFGKGKELSAMGNSTGSMFYAFLAFILIYIVGVLIYQGVQLIKKWLESKKKDR